MNYFSHNPHLQFLMLYGTYKRLKRLVTLLNHQYFQTLSKTSSPSTFKLHRCIIKISTGVIAFVSNPVKTVAPLTVDPSSYELVIVPNA